MAGLLSSLRTIGTEWRGRARISDHQLLRASAFGIGRIDARTKAMTVSLHDIEGRQLFKVELPPEVA